MKIRSTLGLLFAAVILFSCSKSSDNKIDVTAQWNVDYSAQFIKAIDDGQWKIKTFTSAELNLFSSLDTANLAGTTTPGKVFDDDSYHTNYTYPNPFNTSFNFYFRFTNGYDGQVILKTVIVDSDMKPLEKRVIKLQASVFGPDKISTSNTVTISPSFAKGQYRLYYTLSSQANPHFYTTWGNIQKN